MVGAAREAEVVAPPPAEANSIPPTCAAAAAAAAAILPRRILFHAPLKSPPPTASSLALKPLNLHPPLPLSSQPNSVVDSHALSSHYESSARQARTTQTLPTTLVKQIGAGLNNLGNTCFLNAVLQCLTYTPPLAAYFQAGLHKSSCRLAGFCAMCSVESHVKQALSASGRMLSPNQLVKNLRCISRSFQIGRQEDAHEYMRYLIEALQKCCPLEVQARASSSSHRNFIQMIFGGRLRSEVKCTRCSHSSNTYDPFLDLSLDIVKAESLLKALARFTAIDVLDGDNKYHCSKCKTKVRAHKQFMIDTAPHVLTVQFKRFSSSGGCGGKIDKKVQFDRSFNLTPFVNGGKEAVRYSLYAVLVHSGWSTHSGHYFCFVRTATDIWYKLDDSRVSQVSEKSVLEQKAYILFYVRDTEILPTSNGNNHGAKSERFSMPHGTSDVAKVDANGTIVNAATAHLNGNLHMVSSHGDISAVRDKVSCFSSTLTNHTGNIIPSVSNGIEDLVNGNLVMGSSLNSLSKACKSAPAELTGNMHQCSTKFQSNGVLKSNLGNNNVDVQMNGDMNAPSIISPAKVCRLPTTDRIVQTDVPNGFRMPEGSCLTEKKIKMNGNLHHNTTGNGSVKRVCLITAKEVDVKEHIPEKLEGQAPRPDDLATGVLSNKKKPVCDKKDVEQPKSSATLSQLKTPLFETAVPRWDIEEEDRKRSPLKEHNFPSETVGHCGHVLDEWDEEYDRGKRKKVRSKVVMQQGILEVTERFHKHKKRKKMCCMPEEQSSAGFNSNGDHHINPFQVVAGKMVQTGLDAARPKKLRKRERALGHKLFLKRHRFKQLHSSRHHRKKR